MKIRGHGNGLAIALAGLAVVFAASGTAYAVTATTVNIADPSSPSRIAKVDPVGRLTTVGASSSLNLTATSFPTSGHGDLYSAPTTATLAISKFSVTALTSVSATYAVYLFTVPVLADGTCSTTSITRIVGYGSLASGGVGGQDYVAPLVVTPPAGGVQYCLDLYYNLASSGGAGSDSFGMQIAGYVAGGKYPAAGAAEATPAAAQPKSAAVTGR